MNLKIPKIENTFSNNNQESLEMKSIARAIKKSARDLANGYKKEYVMEEIFPYLRDKGIKFFERLESEINQQNNWEKEIFNELASEKIKNLMSTGVTLDGLKEHFDISQEFIEKYINKKAA